MVHESRKGIRYKPEFPISTCLHPNRPCIADEQIVASSLKRVNCELTSPNASHFDFRHPHRAHNSVCNHGFAPVYPFRPAGCPSLPRKSDEIYDTGHTLSKRWTESAYALQHLLEHVSCYNDLCKLKHQPPGVAHQPSAYVDEPGLHTSPRPVLYRFRQSQPSYEVPQVVGQRQIRVALVV